MMGTKNTLYGACFRDKTGLPGKKTADTMLSLETRTQGKATVELEQDRVGQSF